MGLNILRRPKQLQMKRRNKGQSFSETALLFMIVVAAIFLMARYVKRASEGRIYSLIESGLGTGLYNENATITSVREVNKTINTVYETVNNETVVNQQVSTKESQHVIFESGL